MKIVGILNVTPDSFSDGGRYLEATAGLRHARTLISHGADIVDVGGESTRPGATPVSVAEEQRRVLPVVEALSAHGIVVSIDTRHSETALAAIKAGARIVNDVTGGRGDERMLRVVADADVDYVAMHWGGGADAVPPVGSIIDAVISSLTATRQAILRAGVPEERLILDPGLGFGKSSAQNWELVGSLRRLAELGPRVLVGHSRKRFLGELLPADAEHAERDVVSAAVSALCAEAGAWGVRVHDPSLTREVLRSVGSTRAPSPRGAGRPVRFEVETEVPTMHGVLRMRAYRDLVTGAEHVAMMSRGRDLDGDRAVPPLVRVHSECLTGEAFGSLKCECGPQLEAALDMVAEKGGAVIYLRGHEGRGIGLIDKFRAYRLQEDGLDTLEANVALGLPGDSRDYSAAAAILDDVGMRRIRLLTNNPEKVRQLEDHGVDVADRIPLLVGASDFNQDYLDTKRDRMGHLLPLTGAETA